MQGHFNPDIKKPAFTSVASYEKDRLTPLTQAHMKFQRLCFFRPDLEFAEKAEAAGLTVGEAESWWEVAYKAMSVPPVSERYPEVPEWVTR